MRAGCRVTTDTTGQVRFASATHEVGTGVRTVMTQVAADASGLPLAQVAFESGDSLFPDASFSGASQTTTTVGSAVFKAAGQWKQRFLTLVCADPESSFFGADPATLDVVQGGVQFTGDSAQSLPVERFLQRGGQNYADALSFTVYGDAGSPHGPVSQSFGAQFCEVEVDEPIGRASVVRWVAVFDCGRILNPTLARNQIMGAITFGLGMALLEQLPRDARTGKPIGEYYLPTHADRPQFDIGFIDTPDYGLDPIGVRGIGEIGIAGAPAAIANAIFHATGKRVRDLPIRLEHLMTPYQPPAASAAAR
jgi:xanthine dehydrogenase YagR molybdenum-binding subunit